MESLNESMRYKIKDIYAYYYTNVDGIVLSSSMVVIINSDAEWYHE